MIKIYLINLERSHGRLQRFEGIAKYLGIEFTRISGIDGKSLSSQQLQKYTNPAPRFGQLSPSEIGCFLSHRKAWQTMLDDGQMWSVVLEDDIYLSNDAPALYSDLAWIPPSIDIVKFETTLRPVRLGACVADINNTKVPRKLHRLLSSHGGTAGYMISSKAVRTLLDDADAVKDPLDEYLFNPKSLIFPRLNIVQMTPAICVQHMNLTEDRSDRSLNSTIQEERNEKWNLEWQRNKPKGISKIFREVVRPFKKALNFIISKNRRFGHAKSKYIVDFL